MTGENGVGRFQLMICAADDFSEKEMRDLPRLAERSLSPGRFLVAYWRLSSGWRGQRPVEATLTSSLCGTPEGRGPRGMLFFANMGIRIYGDEGASSPEQELAALLLRRRGPPMRELRHRSPASVVEASRLDTRDFAFTRDVANSVWHLQASGWRRALHARFARLLSWENERVAVRVNGKWEERETRDYSLKSDIVPVPEKYECPLPRMLPV